MQLLFKTMTWNMTGANIDKCQNWQAPRITINYCHYSVYHFRFVQSTKFHQTEAFAVLLPNYGLKDDRCQHWQVSRTTENLLSSMNSTLSNYWLCKILWKMVNVIPRSPFPTSCSSFPILKIGGVRCQIVL